MMKLFISILLGIIALFLLTAGTSVGHSVFLEMTKFMSESDQEYGVYAFWVWTVLATIFVIVFALLFSWLLVAKFSLSEQMAFVLPFIVFFVSIGAIIVTAVAAGFSVAVFNNGGY